MRGAPRAPHDQTHDARVARQIRFILLQNRQGRTRLAKYYVPLEDGEKRKLEFDIHRLVVNRDPKFTNFLEVRCRAALLARKRDQSPFGAPRLAHNAPCFSHCRSS